MEKETDHGPFFNVMDILILIYRAKPWGRVLNYQLL